MTREPIPLADITDEEIFARLRTVVAASLRIDPARVTIESSLLDLGAESIDVVEMTFDIEHAFTVLMPERSVLQLATDVAGEGVFERDGALTPLGSELLRARLPNVEADALGAGTPVKDSLPVFLRVAVWIRLIRGLLDATPRECPACRGRLVQGGPRRVTCDVCGTGLDVPSGDDIGREWVRRWMAARTT